MAKQWLLPTAIFVCLAVYAYLNSDGGEQAATEEKATFATVATQQAPGPAADETPGLSLDMSRDGTSTGASATRFEQNLRNHAFVFRQDAASIESAIRAVHVHPQSVADLDYLSVLIARLAELEPAKALDYALKTGMEIDSFWSAAWIDSIFQAWSRNDLDQAIKAASSLPESLRIKVAAAILSANKATPALIVRLANDLRLAYSIVLRNNHALLEFNSDPAFYWKSALSSGLSIADLEDVARSWARTDPGAAASAVYKLNQEQLWIERSGVGAEVIALWVAERPQEAIGWARSLPDGPARQHVVTTVFRAFASTDPKMALDAVIDWPDESERGAAVAAVLSSWASTDLPAAARAFESLSDPTARRESVFTIGNRMAKANPVEAFNWATTLPTEESARILPSIVGVQAQRDISVARRMVESVREHEAIQEVASYFASAWVDQDPRAALRWAQSELSGDVLRSTMKHIFATWATNDPTGAAQGLALIDSRDLSDQAALTLLQSCERPICNRLYKNLSGDVALERGKRILRFRFADFDDVAG